MDTQSTDHIALELIPANRRLLDELSAHKLISSAAREYGLELLYPSKNWGLWAARLLTVLGVALVLVGIVYFFAFNWTKITPVQKLGGLQLAILVCLGASFRSGIHQQLSGRIMLLSASVLVGVFLAVFGQIYQTGADAYNLFMVWAALILPWVVISEFGALWLVWLVVANTFLVLWWIQAAQPNSEMESLIFCYLALFNGVFLGLREYLVFNATKWLQPHWTRVVLVITVLLLVLIPSIAFIVDLKRATDSVELGVILSAVIHLLFYSVYRFRLRDMWSLAATILSGCIIVEVALFKSLTEMFGHHDAITLLSMSVATLGLFTFAIVKLRHIAKEMEVEHA